MISVNMHEAKTRLSELPNASAGGLRRAPRGLQTSDENIQKYAGVKTLW
jgi:hypothetical protein